MLKKYSLPALFLVLCVFSSSVKAAGTLGNPAEELCPGDIVVLYGLKTKAYNGQEGLVLSKKASTGKYKILINPHPQSRTDLKKKAFF